MIKKSMLSLALLSFMLSGNTGSDISTSNTKDKFYYENFIQITYDKETNNNEIAYHYYIKNIGDVPMRKLYVGYRNHEGGCQAPPQNIASLTASIPEWTVQLERQEENPNKCIVAATENSDYPLESGQILTITVNLKKDDPVFENFGWEAIFTRAPIRLSGLIGKASDSSEEEEEDAF